MRLKIKCFRTWRRLWLGERGFAFIHRNQCLLTSENKSSELPHPAVSVANSQCLVSFLKSQIHLFHYSVRMAGSGLVSEPRKRSVSSLVRGNISISPSHLKNLKAKEQSNVYIYIYFYPLKTNSKFLRQRTVNI